MKAVGYALTPLWLAELFLAEEQEESSTAKEMFISIHVLP